MQIKFTYTSPQNDIIDLANNNLFVLKDVDGLTGVNVSISSAEMAIMDGDIETNTKTDPRQIVIYIEFRQGVDIEAAKNKILAVIKPKQTGVLTYTHEGRTVAINATVENISMPRFTAKTVLQIKYHCAYPYWQDAEWIINNIKHVLSMHHFKLVVNAAKPIVFGRVQSQIAQSILNDGDVTTGITFTIIAYGTVINPKIEREEDGAAFRLNQTMNAGDVIEINTTRGKKRVSLNGTNIINKVQGGSNWLQLNIGYNTFTLSDDNNATNVYLQIKYKRSYV
ncbi:tail protein [Butyrivibrio virus Arian]|nr:tail protein [Butyrivibrio virus Arian]